MQLKLIPTAAFLTALVLPTFAQAYIGPGMGAGAIAAVLGTVAAIFMAFVALLWYPLKGMIKGNKKKSAPKAEATEA